MDARKCFSRIGWIFVVFTVFTTALQLLVGLAAGIFYSYLPVWLFDENIWLLVAQAIMYVFGFPVFVLLMRHIPACRMEEPKTLGTGYFLVALVVCLGSTYIGNIVGEGLMGIAKLLSGVDNTNPLVDVTDGMDLKMLVLTTVLIAPVMEELMFRKFLVDRLVPFGQKTAVVISGVVFGLAHGNFYQFFYATALGMIFAYLYSTTGKIRYNILLHMIINVVGGVLSVLLVRASEQGMAWADVGLSVMGYCMIGSIVATLVLLCLYIRKLPWFTGWARPEGGVVRAVLTAPGMWGLLAVSAVIFAIS